MKVYLVYDDSCPVWNCVLGVFKNKDDAFEEAKNAAGSNYKWIKDEERWESPRGESVWISERKVKKCKQKD